MHRFPFSVVETLLISFLLLLCFHIVARNQTRQRTNLLEDPTHLSSGAYPSWATSEQKAYIASLRGDTQQAADLRKEIASWSLENQYNLWTYLAVQSITSGEVTDLNRLQEAEQYLSWAADLQTTTNAELEHNLRTVRELLSEEQETEQQENAAWEEEQQPEQENNEQQAPSWSESKNQQNEQQGGEQQQPKLSDTMKQQLEQYQQQLLAEQAQNQQFFDKRPTEAWQNDPFAWLNQLFWWDPQFDQQTTSWTKDW